MLMELYACCGALHGAGGGGGGGAGGWHRLKSAQPALEAIAMSTSNIALNLFIGQCPPHLAKILLTVPDAAA